MWNFGFAVYGSSFSHVSFIGRQSDSAVHSPWSVYGWFVLPSMIGMTGRHRSAAVPFSCHWRNDHEHTLLYICFGG